MPKPNTQFKLTVRDIDLIEQALRNYKYETREVQELLGKIHNQKQWYRPNKKDYVSGQKNEDGNYWPWLCRKGC